MMSVDSQIVKELREKTGVGMMDCKRALLEASGNIDQALEILRKQGLAAVSKRAARVAADGLTESFVSKDGKIGVLLELNCETDFVAKNDDFKKLAQELTELIADKEPVTVNDVYSLERKNGGDVGSHLNMLVSRIGEKIELRRFVRWMASHNEKIGAYVHLGGKIGVLIKIKGEKTSDNILKDISMHVAASHPSYLHKGDIPQEVVLREKEIYREQLKASGKPPPILEKIVEGKLAKFSQETCLNEQIFIKDPTGKKTVSEVLKEVDPSLCVVSFIRYQVGEGIEKKKDDFAEEVGRLVS